MLDKGIAQAAWELHIRSEAEDRANKDNELESCCGPYGEATWKDYEDEVRVLFEQIGLLYVIKEGLG